MSPAPALGIFVLAAAAGAIDPAGEVSDPACASAGTGLSCTAKGPDDQVDLLQTAMRVQSRPLAEVEDRSLEELQEKATSKLQEEADVVAEFMLRMQNAERDQARAEAPPALLAEAAQAAVQRSGEGEMDPPPEVASMGDKLLFSIPRQSKIFQMNLDGTDVKTFVASGASCPHLDNTSTGELAKAMMGRPEFVAVDVDNNRMFWGDWLGGTGSGNASYNASILSSPLNSPQIDPVVTSAYYRPPPGKPEGVPGCDGYGTWTCPPASFHVPTGDLPITHLDSPYAVAVDPVDKMVYWSDRAHQQGENGGPSTPKIQRASYDGHTAPPEDFKVDGMIGDFIALAIDHREGQRKIYWVEYVNTLTDPSTKKWLTGSQIRRANLDGTGLEVLASHLSRFPTGFALDLWNDQFYWTDYMGGLIQRCPLTGCKPGAWNIGSEPEVVLETFPTAYDGAFDFKSPKLGALALDPGNDMMYWTENHEFRAPPGETAMIYGGMVKGAKMDGSDVKELYRFTAPNSFYKAWPLGLAIVIATPRATTTTTTTPAPATTAAPTMRPGCKDLAGESGGRTKRRGKGDRAKAWEDDWGDTCKVYEEKKYCTLSGGYGPGWPQTGDTFEKSVQYSGAPTAVQACCVCGGGQ